MATACVATARARRLYGAIHTHENLFGHALNLPCGNDCSPFGTQVCRETTELAYDSLGTEITQDEEERTELYAYQAAMGVAGVLYVAGGNSIFSALFNQATSFKILGLSIGVGGTLANLFLVWYIKENAAFAEQGTMPLIPGFRSCFANRPYMMCVLPPLRRHCSYG